MLTAILVYIIIGAALVKLAEFVKDEPAPLDVFIVLTLLWPIAILSIIFYRDK